MNSRPTISITHTIQILEEDCRFICSKSSGPGGQNVNTRSTRVTLIFNPQACTSLTPEQCNLLQHRLASRLNSRGDLLITSQEHRLQARNKQTCIDKLRDVLATAFAKRRKRRPTKPTKSSQTRRLDSKKRHSQKKSQRRKDW